MKINFEDGSYVEFVKSPHKFNEIHLVIATREEPLKLNINTAIVTYVQFKQLADEIFQESGG